ncbi:uncharacterized protein LOC122277222 isoform X3 [Carya illinoinensis]|uniref:uncharacterized protein LOC122277222 isoform X3 n=1 Tax=Carya illinoinensis TaxID=32201 RepID=UPI001C727DA0|nr:uncharacterized protein LOC122277222 isoform X3 [Carya illinoinensis]
MRTMWLVAALFNPCHMKICYESTESDGILLQDQIGGLQVLHARTRRSMLLSGYLMDISCMLLVKHRDQEQLSHL